MPLAVRLEVLVAAVLCMWGAPAHCVCGLSCAVPAARRLRAASCWHGAELLQSSGGYRLWYKACFPAPAGMVLSCFQVIRGHCAHRPAHVLLAHAPTRCLGKQHQQRVTRPLRVVGLRLRQHVSLGKVAARPRDAAPCLRRQPAPSWGAAAHQRAGKPGVSAPATMTRSVFCAARSMFSYMALPVTQEPVRSAIMACCNAVFLRWSPAVFVKSSSVLSAGAWMPTRSGRTSWRSTTAGR